MKHLKSNYFIINLNIFRVESGLQNQNLDNINDAQQNINFGTKEIPFVDNLQVKDLNFDNDNQLKQENSLKNYEIANITDSEMIIDDKNVQLNSEDGLTLTATITTENTNDITKSVNDSNNKDLANLTSIKETNESDKKENLVNQNNEKKPEL